MVIVGAILYIRLNSSGLLGLYVLFENEITPVLSIVLQACPVYGARSPNCWASTIRHPPDAPKRQFSHAGTPTQPTLSLSYQSHPTATPYL